jgi:hypothetical protein
MTVIINRNDLKTVVRALLQEVLWEIEQQMPDPDAGEALHPEIVEYLRLAMEQKGPYRSLDDVKRELGLDE